MNSEQYKKEISKSRLVVALLSELDASRAMIICNSIEQNTMIQSTIDCKFEIPFENSTIQLIEIPESIDRLECMTCFAGQRLTFELMRKGPNEWLLPTKITLTDLRTLNRLAFQNKMYTAEIITQRSAVYGYAVDINREYIAIDFDSRSLLNQFENVQILVRLIDTSKDVFFKRCRVAQVNNVDSSTSRAICQISLEEDLQPRMRVREFERYKVNSVTLKIEPIDLLEGSFSYNLAIDNASIGGLTAIMPSKTDGTTLIPGLIVRSESPNISFLIIWSGETQLGLKPILSDSKSLNNWHQYLHSIVDSSKVRSTISRKELASILTHSGLLKGVRRTPFGANLKDHIISKDKSESSLVNHRVILNGDEGLAQLHVNLKRISEYAWILADGASLSETPGSYLRLLSISLNLAIDLAKNSALYPRYITFIWSDAIGVVGEFSEKVRRCGTAEIIPAFQYSISKSSQYAEKNTKHDVKSTDYFLLSARERILLKNQFSAALIESLVGSDGRHPVLNSEISKFGSYHKTITKLISVGSDCFIIAHRIVTHNIWSSTGVTNSVIILAPKGVDPEYLQCSMKFLSQDEISFGTDDFLVLLDGIEQIPNNIQTRFEGLKMFSFLLYDLILGKKLD